MSPGAPPGRPSSARERLQARLDALEARHAAGRSGEIIHEGCGRPLADCSCDPPTMAEAMQNLADGFPGGKWVG